MIRRRVAIVAVLVAAAVAAWRTWPVATGVVFAVVAVVAAVAARRRHATRQLRRQHLAPTLDAIRAAVGAPVTLSVNHAMRALIPRPPRQLSPAEEAVRRAYGARVEPTLRRPSDAAAKLRWTVGRLLAPVTDPLRRPSDRQPRIVLTIEAPYLTRETRSYVSSVINAKVPISGLAERWDMHGPRVRASWTVRARPPRAVGVDKLESAMAALTGDRLYVGEGASGAFSVGLDDDSPHLALSAGSGAGKSVLAAVLAVQVLARGGRVIILDRKSSHRWALGHERVTYCATPGDMHEALVAVAGEADERNRAALHAGDDYDPGDRVLIIAEELNGTVGQLRGWWDDHRGKGDPRTSPAVRGLAEILFMGRSAKVHVVAVAQQLTARSLGGGDARENFAVRALARYSGNTWKMLAPHVAMPTPSRVRGRWQVVVGADVTEVQVPMLDNRDARRIAGVPGRANPPDRPLASDVTGDDGSTGDTPALVSITDAVDEGLLPWNRETSRKRMQRDPDRPTPAGRRGEQTHLYHREDLAAWVERQQAAAGR